MKKYIINAIAILFAAGLYAQGIYNNGAKITVATGAYLTIGGTTGSYRNESNGTNGSIDLNGKIKLNGNFINNVAAADAIAVAAAGSEILFTGSVGQTIGGTTTVPLTFQNVTVSNSSGIVATADVRVNGTLNLSTGIVDIGNSNLIFGPTALIAGTPSATNMIVSGGTGQVRKMWSTTGSFTYPIGENSTTANYLPVSLSFNSGTFAAGAYTGLALSNTKYNDPVITGSYLNRNWTVTQSGITAFAANAVFQYVAADVVGTESEISTLRMSPTFTTFNPANTTLHQLSAIALSEFGTFTGGVGYKTLNLNSIMLEGLYNGAGAMRQAWDALGPHFAEGIADNITVELHDATNYTNVIFSMPNVPLSTAGSASIPNIPSIYNGSYYITLKHRNSLETTTATAVSFANNAVNQSFGAPANVFGGNLIQMIDNYYAIFGGDVNQDRIIDGGDFAPVDNQAASFGSGYMSEDVNGDGLVDGSDFSTVDNNASSFVGAATP
ncbi:MAG: hypothetical protein QM800_02025 [Paludibacter sp.]